jgi:uncharacterized membrane protein YdjX (TVP38/TMEM64 family)
MMQDVLGFIRPLLDQYSQAAPYLYILLHIAMAVLLLPCSIMTLLAGVLWGAGWGLAISVLAALLSSTATFLLARSFFRKTVHDLLFSRYPKMSQLLKSVEQHDWKIIALSNLNPLIPASTMGYAFGLSSIPLKRYIYYSAICMLPLQAIFVFFGESASKFFIHGDGLVYFIAVIVVMIVCFAFKRQLYLKLCQLLGV